MRIETNLKALANDIDTLCGAVDQVMLCYGFVANPGPSHTLTHEEKITQLLNACGKLQTTYAAIIQR